MNRQINPETTNNICNFKIVQKQLKTDGNKFTFAQFCLRHTTLSKDKGQAASCSRVFIVNR